jgi:hypothetical protein
MVRLDSSLMLSFPMENMKTSMDSDFLSPSKVGRRRRRA